MVGRPKLLASKGIRHNFKNKIGTSICFTSTTSPTLTRCGYPIVERIAMSKRKGSVALLRQPKKLNSSTDFVSYQSASSQKIRTVSANKVGKRPIYRFFIDYGGQYFPLRCMLDLGSMSFVISPEAAKAFSIPVVKRTKPVEAGHVSGSSLKTENLFTIPFGISF